MPSQHLLCYVMLKLLSFYSLGIRLHRHCMACTAPLAQLISQTYFMPFALTANAIVARIFAVISDMLPSVEKAWSLMAVALARAPGHSSPPHESAALLSNALPVLSAPIARVLEIAVSQLQITPPRHGSSEHAASSALPICIHSFSPVHDAITSTVSFTTSQRNHDGSAMCASSQDDMGIPIGCSKKTVSCKIIRKQKRPIESISSTSPSSLKKSQRNIGSEFHRSDPVAILKPTAEFALRKAPVPLASAVDDIFSALCGSKK